MSSNASNRRPYIVGNWKMYKTGTEAGEYIEQLKGLLPDDIGVDVGLAPSFAALASAVSAARGSKIAVAAQNVFWEEEGAFTGEVSVGMIKDLGVNLVIIGHSERRQYFHETDETVNRRVKAALAGGMEVILCIGETLDQREAGRTSQVLQTQLEQGLADVTGEQARRLTVAYEPVWAIGTGRTASPEMAQEAHEFIRSQLERIFDKDLAKSIRIQYGGSVKPENAAALMTQPDIDGALVGGASLKADDFFKIITF